MIAGATSASAQQGLVSDWSNHHVKFTNPGSEMDALMNGHRQQYQSLVNDVRYRAQQIKRSAAWANRLKATSASSQWSEDRGRTFGIDKNSSLQGLWTSALSSPTATAGVGTPQDMFPAEYDANFNTPSCTGDFIAFPVNATGGTAQPNLVVFDNLYTTAGGTGYCSGTGPIVKAAYYVAAQEDGFETYTIQTSPSPSEDGTQMAFVATPTGFGGGSYFYVLTLGSGGTVAAPLELTDAANANGLTYKVLEFDHDSSDTISSPYIDFTNNVAYVGDSDGYLHKFTGVFGAGTLAEDTTAPWPYRPAAARVTLTSPVVDPATGDIFVAASNGDLYCVTSAGASCGAGSEGSFSVAVANGQTAGGTAGAVYDSPVVVDNGATTDTTGWVFAQATYTTTTSTTGTGSGHGTTTANAYAVLAQAPISSTGLGTATGASMGSVSVTSTGTTGHAAPRVTVTTPHLYDGDFDNAYYNSTAGAYTGNMYFCGFATATVTGDTGNQTYHTTPELGRIGFTSNGTLNGSPTSLYLLAANSTTETSGCTPLTEFYNANANSGAGVDYLFLGVSGYGAANDCEGYGCVMSYQLPSGGLAVGTAPNAAYSFFGNGDGSSGIVIDNQSTDAGASQVYFSNLQTGDATGASQSALN